jgi:hypothetical protein
MDITEENAFLFEEHMMGISVQLSEEEKKLLKGLSRHSKREEFGRRFKSLEQ